MQGKLSNFECDLLMPIIERTAEVFGVSYGADARVDTTLRIAADHARATAFLIHDGVLPANDGRGYVLRKIMRRAMRNGRMIGVHDPFLYQLTGFVAELMRPAYPELMESVQRVARVVKDEEHRYQTTFQVAEKVFHDEAKAAAGGVLAGPVAFKLYDTYGLALDEQEEMARDYGLSIDRAGFEREMERPARARARELEGRAAGADRPCLSGTGREAPHAVSWATTRWSPPRCRVVGAHRRSAHRGRDRAWSQGRIDPGRDAVSMPRPAARWAIREPLFD